MDTLKWTYFLDTHGAAGEAVGGGAEVLPQTRAGHRSQEHTGGVSSLRHPGEETARRNRASNGMSFSGKRLELPRVWTETALETASETVSVIKKVLLSAISPPGIGSPKVSRLCSADCLGFSLSSQSHRN